MFKFPPIAGAVPSSGPPQLGAEAFYRRILRVAWAALAVWSAGLWVLAGRAFGCSWAGMIEAAAAELAAVALALALPDYVPRLFFALAMRIRPGDAPARQALLTGRGRIPSARRARGLRRLLVMAAAACTVGGLLSTAGIYFAPAALRWLAAGFLYPDWMWSVTRLAARVALFLPLAGAIAILASAGAPLRRYGPSDPYRYQTRDVMWSAAAGLAAAAGLWWAGADFRGTAFFCAAVLVGLSAIAGLRKNLAVKAVRPVPTATGPRRQRQRWLNLGVFAILAGAVVLQCRLLRDAAGGDWATTWVWVAATAGVAAIVAGWQDRPIRPGDTVEARAAMAGAVILAAMQISLLVAAATQPRRMWLWIGLAGAGQVPFAALAAPVLARRRRLSGQAGHPERCWLADAALGTALGAAGAICILTWPKGLLIAAAAMTLCLMGVFLAGTGAARTSGRKPPRSGGLTGRLHWATAGGAAIVAIVLMWTGLWRAAQGGRDRHLVVGSSLTAYQTHDGAVAALPVAEARAGSTTLTELARQLIRSHPGRWSVVTAEGPELLTGLGEGVRASRYVPEEAFGRLPAWAGAGRPKCFGRYVNIHVHGLDGLYLSGLPVDHADAWCLYNTEAISACARRVAPGGLIVLRASGSGARLGEVFGVVKTFDWAAAGGVAAVAVGRGRLEVLLAARRGRPDAAAELAAFPAVGDGVQVVAVKDLLAIQPDVRATTVRAPGRPTRAKLGLSGLSYWLRLQGK